MYDQPFHSQDLSQSTFLVTGGAGFIGSNLVEYLIKYNAGKVIVVDNLITGFKENLQPFEGLPNFEFVEDDIRNLEVCNALCKRADYVLHQAALGSVPRSIDNPPATNAHNVDGTLNIFTAAKEGDVKRVVFASSSSVYGDDERLPKQEDNIGNQLSPYAVSKYTTELYAKVFGQLYNMELIGLRYFNVFGPNQSPEGAYAAVIPLFVDGLMNATDVFINGDGDQTRDFTFVENAVQANIKALFADNPKAVNQVYNVAVGERFTVNQLFEAVRDELGKTQNAIHRNPRPGDIRDSLADISKAKELLGYDPQFRLDEGLKITVEYFREKVLAG